MKKIFLNSFLLLIVGFCAFVLLTAKENISGIRSFVVRSGSMEPTLPTGSVIVTFPQAEYKIQDIITYELSGQIITHRIADVITENNSTNFVTKGDANNIADQDNITTSNIIGKSIFSIPFLGIPVSFLRTLPGFLTLIILPALIFIAFEIVNIKKELGKIIDKKAEEKARSIS